LHRAYGELLDYVPKMISLGQLTGALVVTAATLTVAGCGSGGTTAAAPATTAPPTDAAGLARELQAGNASVRSAHLTMSVAAGTVTITGAGDELLAQGKLRALDLTETVPPVGELRIVIDAGKTYLKLPTALNHTGKPWVLVSPTSSNPVVRQLESTLRSAEQSTSLDQFTTFTTAARVTRHVQETLNGVPATHYGLSVDIAKLPATLPGKQQLTAAGLTTLPVDLWVDRQGRPLKFAENLTVKGQHVSTTISIGKYDAPVTITPPPAAQVSAGEGTAPA
jgi:hypothetical protein